MPDPIARIAYVSSLSDTDTTLDGVFQTAVATQAASLWSAVDDSARLLADSARAYSQGRSSEDGLAAAVVLAAEAEHAAAVTALRGFAESAGQPVLVVESWHDDLRAARLLVALDACDNTDVPRVPAADAVDQACRDAVARTYRPSQLPPSMKELARGVAWAKSAGMPQEFSPGGVCTAAHGVLDEVVEGVLSQVTAVGEGVTSALVLPKNLVDVRKRIETALHDAGRFLRGALDRLAAAIEWVLSKVGLQRFTDAVEAARAAVENPKSVVPPLLDVPAQRLLITAIEEGTVASGEAAPVAEAYLILLRRHVSDSYGELASTVKTVAALAGVAGLLPGLGSKIRGLAGIFLVGSFAYALHEGRHYVRGSASPDQQLSIRGALVALQQGQIAELQRSLEAEAEAERSTDSVDEVLESASALAEFPEEAEEDPSRADVARPWPDSLGRTAPDPTRARMRRAVMSLAGIALLLLVIALFAVFG